jgi:hypothetical protein
MIDYMRERKYDVVIAEMFDPCIHFLAKMLEIPTTIISSALSMPDEIAFAHGLPVPRSYIPCKFFFNVNSKDF